MGILMLVLIAMLAAWIAVLRTRGERLDREAEQAWDAEEGPYWRALLSERPRPRPGPRHQ